MNKKTNLNDSNKYFFTSILSFLIGIFLFILIMYQQYFCADARYISDNLSYIVYRVEGSTDEYEQILNLRPAYYNLGTLKEIAEEWSYTYLEALILAKNTDVLNENANLSTVGPYDTLARLTLTANDDDINTVYLELQALAAFTSPESEDIMITSAESVYDTLDEKISDSETALENLYSTLWINSVACFTFILVGIICLIIRVVKKHKQEIV